MGLVEEKWREERKRTETDRSYALPRPLHEFWARRFVLFPTNFPFQSSVICAASEGWWEACNPPPGNQELLVVRDKVERPPGEHGVSKSMECDIFPFSASTLLVGRQEGHPACKKLGVGLSVMIWLELCTTYSSSSPVVTTTSVILCFNKHRLTQIHLENGR